MKKAFALLLCILISVTLFSCSDSGISFRDYPVTEFVSTELTTKAFDEFIFQYPSAWSVEIEESIENINGSGTVFGVFAPHGDSGYPSSFLVVIAKDQQVKTTDIKKEYVLSLLEDMQEQTGSAYEVTDFGYYYLGGEETVIYSAKTMVEGVSATVTQAMYVKDGTLYIFNLNTYAEENIADTNAVLSSVLFKSAQQPDESSDAGYDEGDEIQSSDETINE